MNSLNRERTKKTKFRLHRDRDQIKRSKAKRFIETIRKISDQKKETDHAMLAT